MRCQCPNGNPTTGETRQLENSTTRSPDHSITRSPVSRRTRHQEWSASVRAPSCKIGNENIGAEVEFRLEQNPPPSRPSASPVEWTGDLRSENGAGARVRSGGPRVHVQLSADDLSHDVVGQIEKIAILRRFRPARIGYSQLRYPDELHQRPQSPAASPPTRC